MNWSHIIKLIRAKTGMSQHQLAKALDCPQTTLSAIELGQTEDPRFSLASKIVAMAQRNEIDLGVTRALPAPATQEAGHA